MLRLNSWQKIQKCHKDNKGDVRSLFHFLVMIIAIKDPSDKSITLLLFWKNICKCIFFLSVLCYLCLKGYLSLLIFCWRRVVMHNLPSRHLPSLAGRPRCCWPSRKDWPCGAPGCARETRNRGSQRPPRISGQWRVWFNLSMQPLDTTIHHEEQVMRMCCLLPGALDVNQLLNVCPTVSGWARISRTSWTEGTTWTDCKIAFGFQVCFYPETFHLLIHLLILLSLLSSLYSSPRPAGTSWFAWSAWRTWFQGREGTSRSYWSHWTPRRARREGRQRSVRASGIVRTKGRDCECDLFLSCWGGAAPPPWLAMFSCPTPLVFYHRECLEAQDPLALLVLLVYLWVLLEPVNLSLSSSSWFYHRN